MDRAFEILLIEDNPADVFWLEIVLRELGLSYRLTVLQNGEEAFAYFTREGIYVTDSEPDLVLLDINLPRLTGPELLQRLGGEIPYPYCILTGSPLERELAIEFFKLNAKCYLVKPVTKESFLDALHTFPRFEPLLQTMRGKNGQSAS